MADDVRMGIHRHYKGGLYEVTGLAHDANGDQLFWDNGPDRWTLQTNRVLVVYRPLQIDPAHLGPRTAVRSLEDFLAWVHPEDGTLCLTPSPLVCEYEDGAYPRFDYLGPVLTKEMLDG